MSYTVNITYAIEKGWVSIEPALPTRSVNYIKYDKPRRQRFQTAGLTQRGTVRKRRAVIDPAIIAAAERDGVGITAIYNRLKRTGTYERAPKI